MSRFKVGQKVVCIKPYDNLIKGSVYTIMDVAECTCGIYGVFVGTHTRFACVSCPCGKRVIHEPTRKQYFDPSRFAPIEEYTDSLSIANSLVEQLTEVDKAKILNPEKVKI